MKAKRIGGGAVALLAIALAFGESRALRADSSELGLASLMRAVEQVESAISGLARSVVTRQLTTQQLCVSDETGAETCITKAQLDALLLSHARMQVSRPVETGSEISAAPLAEEPAPPASAAIADQPSAQREEHAKAQEDTTVAVEAALDQLEATIAAQAGIEPSQEQVASQVEQPAQPAEIAATPAEPKQPEEVLITQIEPAAPADTLAARSEPSEGQAIATIPAVTVQIVDMTQAIEVSALTRQNEPVITGSMAQTATESDELGKTPPPVIEAPETQPAIE